MNKEEEGFVEIDVHNSPQTVSKSIDNYFFSLSL